MMDAFMSLVKQMREAQREYFRTRSRESLQASKALEKRVDEEIAAAESNDNPQDPNCIVMADGRRLVQGNLFEQP